MRIKSIAKFALGLTAAGYIAQDQYAQRRTDEWVVMRDPNSRISFAQSSVRSSAEKVGQVLREGPHSIAVRTNAEGAESLKRPGLIVERVSVFSIPKPVGSSPTFMSCDGPSPSPSPAPTPSPTPIPQPPETTDWGVARVGSVPAFEKGILAKSVKVCVLDTGVDFTHPDLKIAGGKNFSDSGPSTDYMDRHGHGTHTAGLVGAVWKNGVGVVGASQAQVLIGKVLSDDGYGYNDWIAEGMIWAVDQGCPIISMSLGGPERSAVMESAVVYAESRGVKILAAAGNESSSFTGYPAGFVYPGTVYSVSATVKGDRLAYYSNYGKIELACPGSDILSTVPGGYDTYSGTSMATPICAGIFALYLSTGKEIQYDEIGSPTYFGRGIPTTDGLLK